jgi:hypothetical protein
MIVDAGNGYPQAAGKDSQRVLNECRDRCSVIPRDGPLQLTHKYCSQTLVEDSCLNGHRAGDRCNESDMLEQ